MIYTLKENEIFCCNNGCGECVGLNVWDWYSEEISPCGNYRTLKEYKTTVSSCCRQGVFVWNTEKDEEVNIK